MSSEFERALDFVLEMEGGYTNDPADHGGATNKGITQSEYTDWLKVNHLPARLVADILDADLREIYRTEYWLLGRCDQMPWPVNLAHFDACVNVGVGQAAKFLQRSVGAKADGLVGPKTLEALNGKLKTSSAMAAALRLVRPRALFYKQLVEKDSSQKRFLNGWLNRLTSLWRVVRGGVW